MKTLFKSEITNKIYESKEECLKAEKEHQALIEKTTKEKEERKEAADKVKNAYEEYLKLYSDNQKKEREAYNKYLVARNEFIEKYGSYHMTISTKNDLKPIFDFSDFPELISSLFENF